MSLIVITHPYDGEQMCATCLQLQLRWFRNEIKEQWNRYNNDGKDSNRVSIPLKLNPHYLFEQGVTFINGSLICITHMFNGINAAIEQEMAIAEAAKKPKLEVAPGAMDGFMKRRDLS